MYCKLLVVRLEHKVVGGTRKGLPLHRGDPKGAVLFTTKYSLMYCKLLVVWEMIKGS